MYKIVSCDKNPVDIKIQKIGFFGVGVIAKFFAHVFASGGVEKLSLFTKHATPPSESPNSLIALNCLSCLACKAHCLVLQSSPHCPDTTQAAEKRL